MQRCFTWLFFLIVFGCASSLRPENKITGQTAIKHFVTSLPSEERFFLDFFFRCLIQEDAIGYVLLGGKPLSFYPYWKPNLHSTSSRMPPIDKIDLFFLGFDERNALFHKGWDTWKKYASRFCGKNIYFDAFEQDQELCIAQVIVFNKQLMLSLFDRHYDQFHSFGSSRDSLFHLLLHDQRFKKQFYHRDDLLGIFLGYGEKNAALFQKMGNILTSMGKLGFTLDSPAPARLQNLERELSQLEKSFTTGIHTSLSRKLLFHIGLGFRADFSDPETLLLQKKYAHLHKQLTQAYTGTAFLEKTLELICIADRSISYHENDR